MDWKSHSEHILFLSVDLVGSTNYKQHYSEQRNNLHWLQFFQLFYTEFPKQFTESLHIAGSQLLAEDALWKTLGDEILFRFTITHYNQTELIIASFISALQEFRSIIQTKGLNSPVPIDVKGAGWLSEFPVKNSKLTEIPFGDYIGPSIDIGFRIAKLADSRKFIVSIEVARILLEKNNGLEFYYDGMIPLKGAFGGEPYPIIWIDTLRDAGAGWESRLRKKVDANHLKTFCDSLLNDARYPVSMPFFPKGEEFAEPYPGYVEELASNILAFEQFSDVPSPQGGIDDGAQNQPEATEELFSQFEETLKKTDA